MEGPARHVSSILFTPLNQPDDPTEEASVGRRSPNPRVRPRSPSLGEGDERPTTSFLSRAANPATTQEHAGPEQDARVRRHKVRKAAGTQQAASSRRNRETAEPKSSGLGFLFGASAGSHSLMPVPAAGPNRAAREQPALPPAGSWIPEAEFAALRASGVNVISSASSSTGRVQVAYGPVPLTAPIQPAQHTEQIAPEETRPQVGAAIVYEAGSTFDPVESSIAKVMRAQLRKLFNSGDNADIYKALRPNFDFGQTDLTAMKLAFSVEFLVAVLLVLPDIDKAQATRLGHTLARRQTPGATHGWGLTAATRTVIGQALAHPAVQAKVPLDRLLALLNGANEKGGHRGKLHANAPKNQYTRNSTAYGIAQALARRLVLEAQAATAAGSGLAAVLELASGLGIALDRTNQSADKNGHEVVAIISQSSLPASTKRQLETRFLISYQKLADDLDPADLSGDGGEEPAREEQ